MGVTMKIYAKIPSKEICVTGFQQSGWRVTGESDAERKILPFGFEITDDGNESYLLIYSSHDKAFYGDTWHETLEDAMGAADEKFGIAQPEWMTPNSSL